MDNVLNARLDALLSRVQKPARYTGGEMNTEVIPFEAADVTFAFCFPDLYEIAMSHLGMKILCALVNHMPGALCERVCAPCEDMRQGMLDGGIPLFSLESRTPVNQFDIVGFTLQYEMSYTNVLDMLSLAGIPVRSENRAGYPIVIAGGPCAYNPEPLAPFIDAFSLGDGEESTVEIVNCVRECKKAGASREECLRALSHIEGVYVPAYYEAEYHEDGTLKAFTPTRENAPAVIRRRVVRDLDQAFYPEKIPVPYTEIVHDRIVLEIMRGCTRGCRFCQAGMLYRPVRERSLERLTDLARKLVAATGYEEISLSSLSCGDYSRLPELCRTLIDDMQQARVGVSLPSMRIDNVVKQSLAETARVRKSGLTLAPEAGTQRLRDVINKGVCEDDLRRSVRDAFENGWSTVKLYFMMGLPTETDEDLRGIGHLATDVVGEYYRAPKELRGKGLRVTVSASVFVPKPFTPFQWCAQDALDEVRRKQLLLRGCLSQKFVNFNWHEPDLSMLEACFARGDRRMADVLERAWSLGARMDGWNERFRFDLWMKAFEETGVDAQFYACRERGADELLPWDFIDIGVTKAYLRREYERAMRGELTPDCRNGCQGCGFQRFEGVCAQ